LSISNKLVKGLLISAGSLSLMVGIVGILVPVLPTTPFLLLTALCYMRSSERLYNALLRNRLTGSYVRNYLEGLGMTVKTKVLTLTLLWLILGATIWLAPINLIITLVLLAVGIGVTVHILRVRKFTNNIEVKAVVKQHSLTDV
jgi:uncharacterized membrane protein YbaN (DUF454 family)